METLPSEENKSESELPRKRIDAGMKGPKDEVASFRRDAPEAFGAAVPQVDGGSWEDNKVAESIQKMRETQKVEDELRYGKKEKN